MMQTEDKQISLTDPDARYEPHVRGRVLLARAPNRGGAMVLEERRDKTSLASGYGAITPAPEAAAFANRRNMCARAAQQRVRCSNKPRPTSGKYRCRK